MDEITTGDEEGNGRKWNGNREMDYGVRQRSYTMWRVVVFVDDVRMGDV